MTSLVYKNSSTSDNKLVTGVDINSNNIQISTGGGLMDGYFFYDASYQFTTAISDTNAFDYFKNIGTLFACHFIPSALDETYELFYQHNNKASDDDQYIKIYILDGDLKIDIKGQQGTTAHTLNTKTNFIDSDDLNTKVSIIVHIYDDDLGALDWVVHKNGETSVGYNDDVPFTFDITDPGRYIKFGQLTGYAHDLYMTNIIIRDLGFTSQQKRDYHNGSLFTTSSEIVYYGGGQFTDIDNTIVYNSGTDSSVGDADLTQGTDSGNEDEFFIDEPLVVSEVSYHKMFDGDIHNNIMTTANIGADLLTDGSKPNKTYTTDYLNGQINEIKAEALTQALVDENKSFGYTINDDYCTAYLCCLKGTGADELTSIQCVFNNRYYDSTHGYCSQVRPCNDSTTWTAVDTEYIGYEWMNNFQRKWFGMYKENTLDSHLPDNAYFVVNWADYGIDNSYHTRYVGGWNFYANTVVYNNYHHVNIFDTHHTNKFFVVDNIDNSVVADRHPDIRVSNNADDTNFFHQIGADAPYVYDSQATARTIGDSIFDRLKVGKSIDANSMIIPEGRYMVNMNYSQFMKRATTYPWDEIPFKKIVTLGYFIFRVDTTTNKFSVYDYYIDFNDGGELDLMDVDVDALEWATDENTSYKFFDIPSVSNDLYIFSPIYSNVIIAGKTGHFPTLVDPKGTNNKGYYFEGKVPLFENEDKLVPKTTARFTIKKIEDL